MLVPVLTSKGIISGLDDVCFYLEKAIENINDIDFKIKAIQTLKVSEDLFLDFKQYYNEEPSGKAMNIWNQITKNLTNEKETIAELALSQSFSAIRLVDSAHPDKCMYPAKLRDKAKKLGDNILKLVHELKGYC